MCSERQGDIFKSVWSSLKEGGILIYSTCTYNPDENEFLLEKLLLDDFEFETIPLDIPGEWNIDVVKSQNTIGYRFLPHKVKGEGFFCSVLRKKGSYKQQETKLSRDHINPWLGQYMSLDQLANYSTYKFKNSLFLSPSLLLDELTILSRSLYIKQIGIEIAQYKGMDLEPEQGLILLAHEVLGFDKIELSLDETIAFLSHSELTLNLENGYHLVMHNRLALGWIKVEKSKLMNLYPQGWKIRTKKLN
jgi:NOL1/NOP2/fmu family ribosome biogenesis protein